MDKYLTFTEYQRLAFREMTETERVLNHYDGLILPPTVSSVIEDLKTFEVRDQDCWILTYPKAGTSWTQEIVSCVIHDGNLDEVNKRHCMFRVPYLERSFKEEIRPQNVPLTHVMVRDLPSPRLIKSHLPGHLLPQQLWQKNARIIYVIRNPKDLAVSFFHFYKMIDTRHIKQEFGEFCENMMNGKSLYGPWWDHVLFFWERRHNPNILLLRFEDMKADLRGHVVKISQFLGKEFSDETLDAITEHCTFANMKANPMANMGTMMEPEGSKWSFMRKGIVGDWKAHFTVAQNEAFDDHVKEKLAGSGLTFDF